MKVLAITCLLICLTGCWGSRELTDYGFLMGVSLDQTKDGRIELNAHVYSPIQTIGGAASSGKLAYTTIKTVNKSVMGAFRSIPLFLGRKAQVSHMRVILIGEQFAKENDLGKVLDLFYRDHETQLSTLVIITKGKAVDYWKNKPIIEKTMGQQLRTIIESSSTFSGKTKETTLLDVALQLNSKVKTAMIPYTKNTDEKPKAPYVSGVAIIRKGKMVDHLTSNDVKKILMLTNEFENGIIEFPCLDGRNEKEANKEVLEPLSIKTKVRPKFTEHPPKIQISTKIEGAINELQCSSITTEKEVKKLEDHIGKTIKGELSAIIARLQKKKMDVIDIGNTLYKKDPVLWRKWEKDWDDIFADIQFVIDVEVNIKGSSMILGETISEE
jgi:spore germination protein KC